MKIHILDSSVSNLIAAGEVVERPSSVVKELIENSIDAGASIIKIEIEGGGSELIRIVDNGCGMEEKDALCAFQKHATSKIRTKEDLYKIGTLGFRGEALPSISAVSKIELQTKVKDAISGTKIVVEGGNVVSSEEIGCNEGSVFTVRDLFYNTPARKKFLKTEQTETGVIISSVQKLALSHPDISFRLTVRGKDTLFTTGNGVLKDAVFAVYGADMAGNLFAVSHDDGIYKVSGFIGAPLYSRPNRNTQLFYVNNRVVRSRILQNSLENSYRNSMLIGRYPVCFLFLETRPEDVDINVHPSKIEIKFSDEKAVAYFLDTAIKNALSVGSPIREIKLKTSTDEKRPNDYKNVLSPERKSVVRYDGTLKKEAEKEPVLTEKKTVDYGDWKITSDVPVADKKMEYVPTVKGVRPVVDEPKPVAGVLTYVSVEPKTEVKDEKAVVSEPKTEVKVEKTVAYEPKTDFKNEKTVAAETKTAQKEEKQISYSSYSTNAFTDRIATVDDVSAKKTVDDYNQSIIDKISAIESSGLMLADDTVLIPKRDSTNTESAPLAKQVGKTLEEGTLDLDLKDEKACEFKIIGEVFNSYTLVERGDEVLFIDKHALHERMNFEKLKTQTIGTQYLLTPLVIDFGAAENSVILENVNELKLSGFEVDDFGGSVIVRMIPQILEEADVESVLMKYVESFRNSKLSKNDLLDEFLYDCACKASIKAGSHTSSFELEKLIKTYFERADELKYCPHGRPITFSLSRHSIEKQFKRIV